jgi:hypothetical protein
MKTRLGAVPWFSGCGNRPVPLVLTPEVVWVADWAAAAAAEARPEWEDATLEAQNQLTVWLHEHAFDRYQGWNEHVERFKTDVLAELEPRWRAYQQAEHLGDWFLHSLRWNVLGAGMENEYLPCGHRAFFFLELLDVYEAGRYPCGWEGTWPRGRLLVY